MKQIRLCLMIIVAAMAFAACNDPEEHGDPRIEHPRYIATHDGKLYVTCYSPASVIRIDTATLQQEALCRLGNYQPEGIAVAGGKLFVASSWIADEAGSPLYDNKVYVIDLNSFSVTDIITVGVNPQKVMVVDDSHVIVNYIGNYDDITGGSVIIDVNTLATSWTGQNTTSMCCYNGLVYGYDAPYGSGRVNFFCYNPATDTTLSLLEGNNIQTPYGINVIEGDIYITTGDYNANSDIYRFGADGTLKWRSEAGIYASKVVAIDDSAAYVLNEGNWGGSNASLDRIRLSTGAISRDVFSAANGRGLGDVAQDVVIYGSRAYVAVSFSNTIEAVSLKDNTSTRINL